jgi:signal transduction histidine kinase
MDSGVDMKNPADTSSNGGINEELLKQLVDTEKMAELGRISAGIAHELNAPLSVIASAAQMILREAEVPEFVREMVARIGSEAQRLSHLARGMLSFSSHDSTPFEVDVNITTRFVLDFISYEAARRAVVIVPKLDFRLPVILIDGNQLKQILLNIIMNALQAMEVTGGTLHVETTSLALGEISIIITDNGPGIPEQSLVKIFQPDFTTKKVGEGTGLGLFVTKTLVEKLGGRIRVCSLPGQGTSFTVTLVVDEQVEIVKGEG